MVGTLVVLRRIPRLFSAAHPHQHFGDGLRSFPIDDHGQQFAIDIHCPEPGVAVFADFYHDAHPSRLARALSSSHIMVAVCWFMVSFVGSLAVLPGVRVAAGGGELEKAL